jgi:hypothetical protein
MTHTAVRRIVETPFHALGLPTGKPRQHEYRVPLNSGVAETTSSAQSAISIPSDAYIYRVPFAQSVPELA